MNRRSAMRTLMAASAGSLFGGRLLAEIVQDDSAGNVIRSESRLVLLDVSVKNHMGGFVSGLARENFTVFENGRPQEISVFDNSDLPVTVGILVDESRSMSPKRAAVLTAALTFIGESNPTDECFVLNFNDTVVPGLLSPMMFSDSHDDLRKALFRGVSEGRTALYDAVAMGLQHLELGKRQKKALVVISDGGDNASERTRHETLARIENSLATIHTIGLFDAEDADSDPGILRQFAKISGGEAYFPSNPSEMVPVCRRIAHDIRARYTMGYLPQARKDSGALRQIRVAVSAAGHGGLTARTRSSYRYDQLEPSKQK